MYRACSSLKRLDAVIGLLGSRFSSPAGLPVHAILSSITATVLGIEKLVHYSMMAGERALASYAYEEGLVHFERGPSETNIATGDG